MLESEAPISGRRTKAERRQEAEGRILEAALELLAAKGSSMMTLADVGERAGYSRALPAHYFGNKDGLIGRLASYMVDRFRRLFVRGPKPLQGMPALLGRVNAYVQGAAEEPLQFRALQIMLAEATGERCEESLRGGLVQANRQALLYFEHQIAAGMERGDIDPGVNARGAAITIVGAMRGALSQWFLDPELCAIEVWRDSLLTMIEVALKPQR